MSYFDTMRQAFKDELEKVAGELQGFTRSGRKPIGVEKLLERENESEVKPSDVVKTSTAKADALKAGGLLALGAGGYHVGRKANEDRKLGRQIRLQQEQQ